MTAPPKRKPGRPRVHNEKTDKSVTMDCSMWNTVTDAAKAAKMSRSAWIALACQQMLTAGKH